MITKYIKKYGYDLRADLSQIKICEAVITLTTKQAYTGRIVDHRRLIRTLLMGSFLFEQL